MASRVDLLPVRAQTGLSLLVVMVVLALGSLLALGAARTGWLNEKLVSTQSDHERTLAAAHALLKDAENDIRGQGADGAPCSTDPAHAGCRGARTDKRPFFPTDVADLADLAARIGTGEMCRQGICLPTSVNSVNPQAFATELVAEAAATATGSRGARYGQFTGTTTRNPLLGGANATAWYWVEVFHYGLDSPIPDWRAPRPDAARPFVYRINAYVQGHKAGTRVWLRSLLVPQTQPTTP